MIRLENGMLVLDYPITKEHAQVIKDFVQYIKEQEQERIIKLLEERTNDSGSVLDETGNSIADLSDLIALIKGETNG
jgi:hypothetical protein